MKVHLTEVRPGLTLDVNKRYVSTPNGALLMSSLFVTEVTIKYHNRGGITVLASDGYHSIAFYETAPEVKIRKVGGKRHHNFTQPRKSAYSY